MKKLLLFLALICSVSLSWAYNFSATAPSGQMLYYDIVDGNAEITYPNTPVYYANEVWSGYSAPTGTLIIPESVTYNDTTYSVTSIRSYAFYGCSGLTSVTIPNSVTSIGYGAFYGCSGLTSVSIGNSVTTIGDGAFSGCSGLTSVTIPNSVTSIGGSAFSGCSGLTSVSIPNSVTSIGYGAFYGCSDLTSVTIGNSVTTIGDGAFYGCSGLTSVTIPNSVTSIEAAAFAECTGLTSVTIGNSVTSIGNGAFYGCSGLTSVTIPNSVTSIGSSAFSDCSGLTSVTIGNSVTEIGEEAFGECSGLTSIYSLSVNPPTIDDVTFEDVDKNIPLYVPAESVYRYTNAFGWSDFTNIIGISTQGIDEVEGSVIRCMGDRVIVNGAVDEMLSIFDITGRMIVHEQAVEGKAYTMPNTGVYMVQVGNYPAVKVVVIR